MPPGARPLGQPQVPKQTSYTASIVQNGKAAIDARKQAAQYGLTGQAQGLQSLYQGGAPTHVAQTQQYKDWMATQGFGAPGVGPQYDVTFGRHEGGKYAGFDQLGELKAATLGRAERQREQDMTQSDMLRKGAQGNLDQLDTDYKTQALIAILHGAKGTFGNGVTPEMSQRAIQAGQTQFDSYLPKLQDWSPKQADPQVSALETANQIDQTPTREYATLAGRDYGVDPNLIAGWFPQASEVSDAATQRNLESLHAYGVPYNEQQGVLGDVQKQQVQGQPAIRFGSTP